MNDKAALVLVDLQANMFDPANPVRGAGPLLDRLTGLVARFRAAGAQIVLIRNCGGEEDPDQPGTPGWELHTDVLPAPGDLVFDKTTADAFASTPLDGELRARGVHRVVIAGLQSEYCIRDTVLGALARGYEVTLVSDGHSTYDGGGEAAEEKSAAVNAQLEGRARLLRAEEVHLA